MVRRFFTGKKTCREYGRGLIAGIADIASIASISAIPAISIKPKTHNLKPTTMQRPADSSA